VDKYYIKSAGWEKIYGFLLKEKAVRVRNREKTRVFMAGVYFIMGTGFQWRKLPIYYGKWRSVHKPFETWSRKGI
jgi:transposase